MSAGMGDDDGMIGARAVEVVARGLATELGFLVARTEDPLPGGVRSVLRLSAITSSSIVRTPFGLQSRLAQRESAG
jgi:hypothetical protein